MTKRDSNEGRKQTSKRPDDIPEARPGWKSKWVESTSPAADDPISPEEMQGHNLLGNASLRGGAIAGVSDPVYDGHGAPGERPDDVKLDGPRFNPPELDDVPGDGGEETTGS
jgi:hypothetical protein